MTAPLASNAKAGTTKVVETKETAIVESFDFVRKGLRFFFPLQGIKDAMAQDDTLLINALKGACEKAAYRNAGEKNALPDEGLVDLALFIQTVKGFAFRGEEKPNKEDKTMAAGFAQAIAAKLKDPAKIAAWFKAQGQSEAMDEETMAVSFMRIRLAAEEARKAGMANVG